MKTVKSKFALLTISLAVVFTQSCKDKDPSFAKVFVRSSSNELLTDARVVIIADVEENESDMEYVDTLNTNSSGFAEFNLSEYYDQVGKSITVAKFDIICRKSGLEGTGTIRTRVNTTAVETIHISQ